MNWLGNLDDHKAYRAILTTIEPHEQSSEV